MMRRARYGYCVAAVLLLAACTTLPDAGFTPGRGVHATRVAYLELPFAALDKQLPLRVVYPRERGRYPVIVLSHGGRLSHDDYNAFADHWATHGYVVIAPTHMDSSRLGFTMQGRSFQAMMEIIRSRREDIRFVLDSLDEIGARVPGLAQRMDTGRLVSAGHSMGGATALTVAGLRLLDPRTGEVEGFGDPRFDALLLIGEPGNNRIMPEEPWRVIGLPTFVATGSKDFSRGAPVRQGRRFYRFDDGLGPAEDTPHHYLYIEDMDHYLGGLVPSVDAELNPDYESLALINDFSTAFLDAYLKDDAAARAFLSVPPAGVLGPRARIELR